MNHIQIQIQTKWTVHHIRTHNQGILAIQFLTRLYIIRISFTILIDSNVLIVLLLPHYKQSADTRTFHILPSTDYLWISLLLLFSFCLHISIQMTINNIISHTLSNTPLQYIMLNDVQAQQRLCKCSSYTILNEMAKNGTVNLINWCFYVSFLHLNRASIFSL